MKNQKGVALVEFALILPMLVMLLFLTTEFGRAYYQYDTITKAVRQSARYLSVRAQGTGIVNARNIIVYGNPNGTGSPRFAGLTLSNVPDPVWSSTGSYPVMNTVTVSVTGFTFVPMAGSVFGMRLNNIVFGTIQATMRSPS
jgi:Flp pilus assembly protein TadG